MSAVKAKVCIFLFFLFITASFRAQEIKMGFRLEPFTFNSKTSTNNSYTNAGPISIYFNLKIQPVKSFETDIRFGALWANEYHGFEFGVFPKYNFYSNFNIIFSFLEHENPKGGGISSGSIQNNIELLGIGLGYNFNKKISIDLIFYKPLGNGDFAYLFDWNKYSFSREKITSLIKLGIGVNWSIANW